MQKDKSTFTQDTDAYYTPSQMMSGCHEFPREQRRNLLFRFLQRMASSSEINVASRSPSELQSCFIVDNVDAILKMWMLFNADIFLKQEYSSRVLTMLTCVFSFSLGETHEWSNVCVGACVWVRARGVCVVN
eukprot:scpid73458/ scgid12768/ 